VPVEEIQLGIRNGVRKINVDTDNRLAITAHSQGFVGDAGEVRSARLPEAGPRGDAEGGALRMTQFGQAGTRATTRPSRSRDRPGIQGRQLEHQAAGADK